MRTNGKWVEAMLSPFPDQPRQLMALRPHDIFDDVMTQLKITARNFDDSMSPAARLHECAADAPADRTFGLLLDPILIQTRCCPGRLAL